MEVNITILYKTRIVETQVDKRCTKYTSILNPLPKQVDTRRTLLVIFLTVLDLQI